MRITAPTSLDRQRQEYLAVGIAAVVLSLVAVVVIATNAPWQIRFPVVLVAGLFGPGVPALRASCTFSLGECVVYGVGADVALEMLLGLVLVMVHSWIPVQAFVALLIVSSTTGAKLIVDARFWDNSRSEL